MLDFVGPKNIFGDLRKMVIRTPEGKPLGWYIYSGSRNAVGEVLQIGADSASIGNILDHLFYDALAHGLIGLHGRLEPHLMQELTMRSCFFLRNGSWTLVHSDKVDLLNLFQSGTAFFSRLDGEWALRPGPAELASSPDRALSIFGAQGCCPYQERILKPRF